MVARVTTRRAPDVLRVELECDAGTLGLNVTDDGGYIYEPRPLVPSSEAWLVIAMAVEEFTANEGTDG